MKKLVGFIFLLSLLLSCNNWKETKPSEEPQKQKPVLKKLEILKVSDGSSIKTFEEFPSKAIGGIETEEEKVKIKFSVDLEVKVYFTPDLPTYEFTLSKIGDNVLNIKLEKDGLENVYILTIRRKSTNVDMREIKELRFTTDYVADYSVATVVNKNASDDKLFELECSHIDAERKYFIFVDGKEPTDVVFIEGKVAPYPKADKQRIGVGNLAKAGEVTALDFYLFRDGVDVANTGLGTKYTLKVSIRKEPNTKIKQVKFNNKDGKIDGRQITCEHEFDVGTTIATTLELDAATSTYTINGGNPVKIAGNGANFDIVVVPEEGETFKETYSVKLKAKATLNKKITGIKYYDGDVSTSDDLSETSNREDDVCKISSHDDDNNFSFLPIPSENIKSIERFVAYNSTYWDIPKRGNVFVISKRDARSLAQGIKIKVTFNDDTTDEFTIKKE